MSSINIHEERIKTSVINMLKVNMEVKDGEKILILTDYPTDEQWAKYDSEKLADIVKRSVLAKVIYEICKREFLKNEVSFLTYPATGRHGTEPPEIIARAMRGYDVIIALTSFSISHTEAREKACLSGARIASMPGFTVEMLEPDGPMAVDYKKVAEISKRLAEVLSGKEVVRVMDKRGTDISFIIKGRVWGLDIGIYSKKGAWGNLPAGEVYIAPLEGKTTGKFVVPRGWYPNLKEDMVIYVKNGLVEKIEGGGQVGENLNKLLGISEKLVEDRYVSRRNIAELGIGTNPNAKRPDNILEAEKIMGTIHIAIGDNAHIGGKIKSDIHEDFIIPNPTVYANGLLVMKDGKIEV